MYTLQIDQSATAVVTGATGFVGRALLHKLSTTGCRIKILARLGSDAQTLTGNYGAELVQGDILSTSAVQLACEGATHVFHLAGRGQSRRSTRAADETRRINVEGTKILARCIAKLDTSPRLVHLSTSAVHGDIKNGPGDECSPFNAKSTYELTKLEAELWLREFAEHENIPLVVLRPCAIVGPGDQRLLKLFRLASQRWVPIVGNGDHRYQIIHVDDCAQLLVAAGESAVAAGNTYVCGNQETLRLREILELVGTEKSRIISLPKAPIIAVVALLEKLCMAVSIQPKITTSRLGFFSDNHWFDTSKVRKELEVKFEHNNQTALSTTRGWYETQDLL